MSEAEIRSYARERNFRSQTLERWLSWDLTDREALAGIALALKVSENQIREMMDWLEEIALRDRLNIHQVLAHGLITDIQTDPRLGRADKVKRIKDQLRRMRLPRLAETEDAIKEKIRSLRLHPEVRVSVPAGLEGGQLHIEVAAGTSDEFRIASKKLNDAAENPLISEIFSLLSGRKPDEGKK